MLTFRRQVDSDMFVLALPLSGGSEILGSWLVGGLSAATAMVIVNRLRSRSWFPTIS
jgi:hypothetical protein